MRVGIITLLHESNTFAAQPTTIDNFRADMLLEGESIRESLSTSQHEIGGFFAGLQQANEKCPAPIDVVPVFAARALPSGTVTAAAFDELRQCIFAALKQAGHLDGILVAPHGAMVSEAFPDADGHWLAELRDHVGWELPIVGTVDAHANLSKLMVTSCDALVAYRSNPHLDQRERGIEAADLIVRAIAGEIRPIMCAEFPPLAINIERQHTGEPHLLPLYRLADSQIEQDKVLSNSILLGFPYADVAEMGSAALVITDNDQRLARTMVAELCKWMWEHRQELVGELINVDEALDQCRTLDGSVCLLDMGDNVGGGSSGDGTIIAWALHAQQMAGTFVCIFDPESVAAAEQTGAGNVVELRIGGKTDSLHGDPLTVPVTVRSMHDGTFAEARARHGGISRFDQGRTAIVITEFGLTIMLTSHRMVPFSLQQLRSCGLDPAKFRFLVAKGVNAPVAAYREVCQHFIRVNTPGSTCADMTRLKFQDQRKPMFPFDANMEWKGM